MSPNANALIPETFPPLPGLDALAEVALGSSSDHGAADAVGYVITVDGDVPATLGLDRDALARAGFESKVGQTLTIPTSEGPALIAVGAGASEEQTETNLRDIAAAFVRAASTHGDLVLELGATEVDAETAARALFEGAVLGRYKYTALKTTSTHVPLHSFDVTIDGGVKEAIQRAASAATIAVRATIVARDLANTPPGHLTATNLGDIAVALGEEFGFSVELFDKADLIGLGCGGLLGVNQGSAEEPRMIKLQYRPEGRATGHLGLVGKGIMYDSGGISLKPSDPMHLLMKMDMGGAAAVLGAFTGLRDAGVGAQVTGWLMATDNMPSGTSYKLGDVLTARGGTTVEVKNTDAEGRLVMMDALVLANEDEVDAIIDIATLTGAALVALGGATAPVFANERWMARLALDAAAATDEPLWELPLETKYRRQLDSDIADISNLGGPFAGATTAALFLAHFVGETPWAHLDIAGTMQSEKDDSWRSSGATGFGARLILEAAKRFSIPS